MILALSPGLPTGTDTDTVALMNCLPVLFARASLKLNSESTKKELEKELDVVNQIQGKLGGLKVTDTAATGLKAEQNDTQAAPAAKPAAAAADGAQMAEKEAEDARLAEERKDKRIAEEQAAAEVAAAAAKAKAKANQNKPVPDGDGSYASTGNPGTLRSVVSDWIAGGNEKDAVIKQYGSIENWDTSEVTNLAFVFYGKSSFNDDISKWVVSSVTNMLGSKSFLANC